MECISTTKKPPRPTASRFADMLAERIMPVLCLL
jgi:hypothetical protein